MLATLHLLGTFVANLFKSQRRLGQQEVLYSIGSTRTIEAPRLLPTQRTGRGPVSSTNTRRMLVVRGSRYSTICPVLVSSRATWSFSIEPVHASPFFVRTTS